MELDWTASVTGRLSLWCDSPPVEPWTLQLLDLGGRVRSEATSAYDGMPLVADLDVVSGTNLRIVAHFESATGPLGLVWRIAPETAATRSSAAHALESLEQAQREAAEDPGRAREILASEIARVLAVPGARNSHAICGALWKIVETTLELGDIAASSAAMDVVAALYDRLYPLDELRVLNATANLAITRSMAGDLRGALELEERVHAKLEHYLPSGAVELQRARANLAGTLKHFGELERARVLEERLVAEFELTSAPEDVQLQAARVALAGTHLGLGGYRRARELLETAHAVLERTLAPESSRLLTCKFNLAAACQRMGELVRARELFEQLLAVRTRTLPPDHPELQNARLGLALVLKESGDAARARELEELALACAERTLHEGHSTLDTARSNLSTTLQMYGDLARARELGEQVLRTRLNVLPPDDTEVQVARGNLANTLTSLGDLPAALALMESSVDALANSRAESDVVVLTALANLAVVHFQLGDYGRARTLQEDVLRRRAAELEADHVLVLHDRANLSLTLFSQHDWSGALALQRMVLAGFEKQLGEDAREVIQARQALASTLAALGRKSEFLETAGAHVRALSAFVDGGRLLSPREAGTRVQWLDDDLSVAMSHALGLGVLEPQPVLLKACWNLVESARASDLAGFEQLVGIPHGSALEQLQSDARTTQYELVSAVAAGAGAQRIRDLRDARDRAERELSNRLAADTPATATRASLVDAWLRRLGEDEALISFWSFRFKYLDTETGNSHGARHVLAFVGRSRDRFAAVDLGDADALQHDVEAWQTAMGVAHPAVALRGVGVEAASTAASTEKRGLALRRRLIEPLLPHLEGTTSWDVVPDDFLCTVPFDALPDEARFLGDRVRISIRPSLRGAVGRSAPARTVLVVAGGIDFSLTTEASNSSAQHAMFEPLPETAVEARGVRALFHEAFTDREATLLTGSAATCDALEQAARKARFLHVATHARFDRGHGESADLGATLVHAATESTDPTRGTLPMLQCGFAVAGANHSPGMGVPSPGWVTGEAVVAWDLRGCELAILSACESNLGEIRRAGQGVASLQKALHMAGARSVITSLWKVPDESTKHLMLEFYRALWIEKKPKWQALRDAKQKLRDAKNERGDHKYSMTDWAAWVLTGEPE